jgi:AP-3 complex subunit delta-1
MYFSELAEPQKLIQYIIQPAVSKLHSDIIAVYIQAATKVFGHWAAELAERWNDSDLPEVKSVVVSILSSMRDFIDSPHIEVQERVRSVLYSWSYC